MPPRRAPRAAVRGRAARPSHPGRPALTILARPHPADARPERASTFNRHAGLLRRRIVLILARPGPAVSGRARAAPPSVSYCAVSWTVPRGRGGPPAGLSWLMTRPGDAERRAATRCWSSPGPSAGRPALVVRPAARRRVRVHTGHRRRREVTVTRCGDLDPGARFFHRGDGRGIVYARRRAWPGPGPAGGVATVLYSGPPGPGRRARRPRPARRAAADGGGRQRGVAGCLVAGCRRASLASPRSSRRPARTRVSRAPAGLLSRPAGERRAAALLAVGLASSTGVGGATAT